MKMNIIIGTARKVILTRIIKEKVEAMGYKVLEVKKLTNLKDGDHVSCYLMDKEIDGEVVKIMKDYEKVHDYDDWDDTFPELTRVYLVHVETGVNVFLNSEELEGVKYAISDRLENLIASIPYVKDTWERDWQVNQVKKSLQVLEKMGMTSTMVYYHDELERVMKEGKE